MEDNTPYLALLQCSNFFFFLFFLQGPYDNKIFRIITTLLKAWRHIPPQAFSQLKVLLYADILYLHRVHEGMHIYAQFNTFQFDIWVQKWNVYCSYLHTCLYTVQKKQQVLTLQLRLSLSVLEKDVNMDLDIFIFFSLAICFSPFGDLNLVVLFGQDFNPLWAQQFIQAVGWSAPPTPPHCYRRSSF